MYTAQFKRHVIWQLEKGKNMKINKRFIFRVAQLCFALTGCVLISDPATIFGVIMFLWANNLNFAKKKNIEDDG